MVVFDNLANTLREILTTSTDKEEFKEWKLLGQEVDGQMMVGWITETTSDSKLDKHTCVGVYQPKNNELKVLMKTDKQVNVIQASVNSSRSLLSYVIKANEDSLEVYQHYVQSVLNPEQEATSLNMYQGVQRSKQVMSTFIQGSKTNAETAKLLVFIHLESISLYHIRVDASVVVTKMDSVTRAFTWAQWDCNIQSLYFIHYKKSPLPAESDEGQKHELSPMLSGLQFHSDLPHETVLNIPLNLPSLPLSAEASCHIYEDDPIPLRIHDCSLDLLVVPDPSGIVCICHHYLYQPIKPPSQELNEEGKNTVHFAYSVTLLHHGCVVHCTLPGVAWTHAKTMRPAFALLGSQYLVVYAPGIFTHLLDVGLDHEPFCHIVMKGSLSEVPAAATRLVAISGEFTEPCAPEDQGTHLAPTVMLDLPTMDLVEFEVTVEDLFDCLATVKSDTNRMAVLHYFLLHSADMDLVEEALSILLDKPTDLSTPRYLQEVLLGGAHSFARKNLPLDAAPLVRVLPMSTIPSSGASEVKVNQTSCMMSQEILWNTAMMLLSPQQRLVPYRTDIWTRLWLQLSVLYEIPRFKPGQVADKLLLSLVCYQPEALSRCSTPMSPGTGLMSANPLVDLAGISQSGSVSRKLLGVDLPFYELESCTASRQEHIIAVNLRELSMHLLKNCLRESPIHVHAVSTRYVAAQLEISKHLCSVLTKLAGVTEHYNNDKGFYLIQQLDMGRRRRLLTLFQRYFYAVDSLAYPLPQGFTSFFCYLGFATLNFENFLQYLHNNVFELQIDVMKEIMKETEDTKEGVNRKLRLMGFLPRSRAKRLLNTWQHAVSLMIRGREHALHVLSGVQSSRPRGPSHSRRTTHTTRGLAAFPSNDRLSPLDTFLDLLTAKASLTDLDFNLLIEATISSTEDILE